jgi:hypothetical protein
LGSPGPTLAPTPPRPPCAPRSLCIIVMSRASCAFSNRSDEDDLPPDLAEAVGTTTATTTDTMTAATQVSVPLASPKVQKVSSPQKSEGKSPLSPGAKVWERAPRSSHPCWEFRVCLVSGIGCVHLSFFSHLSAVTKKPSRTCFHMP